MHWASPCPPIFWAANRIDRITYGTDESGDGPNAPIRDAVAIRRYRRMAGSFGHSGSRWPSIQPAPELGARRPLPFEVWKRIRNGVRFISIIGDAAPASARSCGASRGAHVERGKRRFPPSLNAVRSEYKRFCKEHGGPIIVDDSFAEIDFEHCCREFPRRRFQPIIDDWATDPVHGNRHWPVMAFAASQYAFRQREFSKYGAEASPAQVAELLGEIGKSSRRLRKALGQLQEMSARLRNGTISWTSFVLA